MAEPTTFTVFVTHHEGGYDPNRTQLAALWVEECFRQGGAPTGTEVELEWVAGVGSRSAGWSIRGLAYPPSQPPAQSQQEDLL